MKEKGKIKTEKWVELRASDDEIIHALASLPQRAIKQKQMLERLLTARSFPLKQLLSETNSTFATVQALMKKQLVAVTEKEIYRDPYANRSFTKTKPLPLTDEQRQALQAIGKAIDEDVHDVF
ncbi:hypothetical protein LR68_00312 [Anoxybacillus sp. BCO1]|nr:hypothetical protein LR68_00312 [Anoxybacillus sp. BCO1]